MKDTKLSHFELDIPEQLIAKKPAAFRDDARMLVLHRQTGEIEHRHFRDILDYFEKDDVFVFNDTKVFPARMYGNKEKTGAQIEVFLLRELNPALKLWDVVVDPARKIRIGNKLYFGKNDELVAEVIDNTTSRGRTLRFLYDGDQETFRQMLYSMGETPLPKYMNRTPTSDDSQRYQTLFARNEGAVIGPAAGFHFSRELLLRMEIRDIHKAFITVHNGLGNYRDIDVEDLTKYKMESEQIIIPEEACTIVNKASDAGRNICAVGTSTLRAMETASGTQRHMKPFDGWTSRFIFPPYEFNVPNRLVTNLHTSKSILLMMAAAFGGYEHVMHAYSVAIKEKYRFGAYGDAMFILD